MRRIELLFYFITLVVDILLILGIFLFAYYLRYSFSALSLPYAVKIPLKDYFSLLFLLIPVWIVIFFFSGVYRLDKTRKIFSELSSIFFSVSFAVVVTITLMFILKNVDFSRLMLVYIWVMALLVLSLWRILLYFIRRLFLRRGLGVKRVLLLGSNESSQDLAQFLESNPQYGLKIVLNIAPKKSLKLKKISQMIDKFHLNQIILGESFVNQNKNIRLLSLAHEKRIIFCQIPTLYELSKGSFEFETIGDIPLFNFKSTPLDGWGRILKRIVDLSASLILLIILLPFFLVMALIIKFDSFGPVFFKQKRVAKNGEFFIYKFRSMVANAEELKKRLAKKNERSDGPLFKIKNDPRVTRIGRILRQTRIDELPQLINVFRGEMSLVGPRPHLPQEVRQYKKQERKVLFIKPGLTGLAQISGASELSFEEEIKLDAYYIENWSILLDFIILLKTIGVVLTKRGAA